MNVLQRYLLVGVTAAALMLGVAPVAMAATGPSCTRGADPWTAPSGWWFVTTLSPGRHSCSVGPALKWNDDCYWTYASNDNACAFKIVEYKQGTGNILGSWTENGQRYIGKIKVDDADQTVTFCGQPALCYAGASGTTVPFAELNIDSSAGDMPEVPYAGALPLVLAAAVGAVWWVKRSKARVRADRTG